MESFVKIGHTLHINKVFENITYSKRIEEIQKIIGIESPLVVQSMILEKLPMKGSTITLHQDSTFLFTDPDTLMAWWIPLQDVD